LPQEVFPQEVLRYEVAAGADAADLQVEVAVPPGLGGFFTVDPAAVSFVEGVSLLASGAWVPVEPIGGAWRAPACQRRACRLRYTFHLRAAAHGIRDPDLAAVRGEALVAPPGTWLLRPRDLSDATLRGRLHVTVPSPLSFVTGLPPAREAPDTYAVALLPLFLSPYSAFGRFEVESWRIGGADISFAVAIPSLGPDRPRIRSWIGAAARAVASYFGRFPVDHALVLAVPQDDGLHGQAMGGGGASVLLQMAPGTDLTDPAFDWQAAHEMVHLAIPEMSRAQIWLAEGMATYVEPLARSMTGELGPESVWGDLVLGLPKGLPGPSDRGLDRTHTWGRTYWGGALFAFLADLEIRKQSGGAQSLATALRGVLRNGGDMRVVWTMERFTATCDQALGKPIVTNLYHRMGHHSAAIDLPALWRELGVSVVAGHVEFDDHAPLAAIRRKMTGPVSLSP
jgi:hypothetical protein